MSNQFYMMFDGAREDTKNAAQRAADRTGHDQHVHYHRSNEECDGREHLTVKPIDRPAIVEPYRLENRTRPAARPGGVG